MRLVIICTTVLVLVACGAEESSPTTEDAVTSSDDRTVSESQSKPEAITITTTTISIADATGETSEMIEPGPCPFLSDEKIIASVRSTFEIGRREVSNTLCRWAYNAGFSIEVTIEDLASATPVSERGYNTDVETISTPQDGPGMNAVVVSDTAWDEPRPFAYSFEQDGKLIFMRYTGFNTNAEIMRPAANEIAALMGAAPTIEPQRRHATEPFQACDTWNEQDIKSVFGVDDTAVVAPGMRGTSRCSWTIYEDGVSGQKTAAFSFYKPESDKPKDYEAIGFSTYSDNGETHYIQKNETEFGKYINILTPRPEVIVTVTVSDPQEDRENVAKILQANLLSRLVP